MFTEEKAKAELMDDFPGSFSHAYKVALEQRAFEISQLTNRNNFFMVFQGVLLAGLIQSQGAAPGFMNFFVCMAGMGISLYQAAMAGGAKYWQIRWEVAVRRAELNLARQPVPDVFTQTFTADMSQLTEEEQVLVAELFELSPSDKKGNEDYNFIKSTVEKDLKIGNASKLVKWIIGKKFSVSRIPIAVGLMLFLIWLMLWSNTFSVLGRTPWAWMALLDVCDVFAFVKFDKT